MKKQSKERQRTIESTDALTFDRLFEKAMEELSDYDVDVVRNMSKGTHCAYLCWREVVKIPEDIRDEYILRGDERTCADCPELVRNGDGRVKRHSCPVSDNRRLEDKACLRYYRKLEGGEYGV